MYICLNECKQINSFKNKITFKLFTNKSYMYICLNECKQINSFKNKITFKLFTNKSYMYICLNECKQITDVTLLLLDRNTWNH